MSGRVKPSGYLEIIGHRSGTTDGGTLGKRRETPRIAAQVRGPIGPLSANLPPTRGLGVLESPGLHQHNHRLMSLPSQSPLRTALTTTSAGWTAGYLCNAACGGGTSLSSWRSKLSGSAKNSTSPTDASSLTISLGQSARSPSRAAIRFSLGTSDRSKM